MLTELQLWEIWTFAGSGAGVLEVTIQEQHNVRTGVATSPTIGYAILTFEFHKEGGMWVGECRELGTATDGRSLEKVEAELARLVALDLTCLEELGERERLFQERSIKLYPVQVPDQVELSVPVNGGNRLVQARSIAIGGRNRESAVV